MSSFLILVGVCLILCGICLSLESLKAQSNFKHAFIRAHYLCIGAWIMWCTYPTSPKPDLSKVMCTFQGEAYAVFAHAIIRTPSVDDDCAPLKRPLEAPVG